MDKNKLILIALFFASSSTSFAQIPLRGKTFFAFRSQSVNAARQLAGWHPQIHRFDKEGFYSAFSVAPAYYRSFRPERIAEIFFGTPCLTITGSQVTSRDTDDLLADYFGLSPVFESTAKLCPTVRNALVDFDLFLAYRRFYFRIHAPAVSCKTEFDIEETITNDGSGAPFPAAYMADAAIAAPVQSFKQAINGGITFGHVTEGLNFTKISSCPLTQGGLADLRMHIGWEVVRREKGHVGLHAIIAYPTGNTPCAEFLLEPIVGNGNHWEFGVGMSSRVIVWERDNDYGEQELGFHADINITHLFDSNQCRVFDLCENGFGSRYILVKEFDENGVYTGLTQPLANITHLNADVHVNIQIDIALMFGYRFKGFVFDLGYNGWIRSREKVTLCGGIPDNTYGLKGIQDVTDGGGTNIPTTQSTATLNGNAFADQAAVADPNPPVFLSTSDINVNSAGSSRAITHKIFTDVSYAWINKFRSRFVPFLGGGFEVEFEGTNERLEVCPSKNTLSQWGIWIKGGGAF